MVSRCNEKMIKEHRRESVGVTCRDRKEHSKEEPKLDGIGVKMVLGY